jgi:hypothetical protein
VNEDKKPLRVVALLAGKAGATELWTLRCLAAAGFSLHVVQARYSRKPGTLGHLRRLISSQGVFSTFSRSLGSLLFRGFEHSWRQKEFDLLFDIDYLQSWWERAGIPVEDVPYLNHEHTVKVLSRLQADFIVRVSGGVLREKVFSTARVAALNIHHGVASQIRGMWSIPWAIVEGRPEWIGATVHIIDAGIDTGAVLWCGSPQLAPGDTAIDLFFRAHLEAVEALVSCIQKLSHGFQPVREAGVSQAVYRSAPGILTCLKYLAVGRGKHARITIEKAIRC